MSSVVLDILGIAITGVFGLLGVVLKNEIKSHSLHIEDKLIDEAIDFAEDFAKQYIKENLRKGVKRENITKLDKVEIASKYLTSAKVDGVNLKNKIRAKAESRFGIGDMSFYATA